MRKIQPKDSHQEKALMTKVSKGSTVGSSGLVPLLPTSLGPSMSPSLLSHLSHWGSTSHFLRKKKCCCGFPTSLSVCLFLSGEGGMEQGVGPSRKKAERRKVSATLLATTRPPHTYTSPETRAQTGALCRVGGAENAETAPVQADLSPKPRLAPSKGKQ